MVKKKAKPPKPEKLEDVKKTSRAERVQQKMHDCLKDAQSARTNGVALRGVEYADKLSKKICNHADQVEDLFTKVKDAVKKGCSSELTRLEAEIDAKNTSTQQRQA